MTIAAGFNFNGGILLCADKKHSAQMKLAASKIFRKEYDDGSKSVIVIAGNVMYARMGMQAIEALIEAIPRAERTTESMAAKVSEAVRFLHQAHLFKHPDRPEVQYIVGLWSPSGGLRLMTTDDTAINELRGYDCVGAGAYLAHYLIRAQYQESDKSFYDVLTIAINALARIKAYDDACGGDSEFVKLLDNGEIGDIGTVDIGRVEEYSDEFSDATSDLFICLSRPNSRRESIEQALKKFSDSLREASLMIRSSEVLIRLAQVMEPDTKEKADLLNKRINKLRRGKERKRMRED